MRRGVTVWELLGVVVIILVVAAILFPVFAKGHPHDNHHSCMSDMKWIGLALSQYTENYDTLMPNISDALPSKVTWRAMIYDEIKSKQPYRCPDDYAPDAPDGFAPSYAANYSGNYNGGPVDDGNGTFAGPGSHPLSLLVLPNMAHLILLCEVDNSTAPEFNIDDPTRFGPGKRILSTRHEKGSNYLFADGHSKWLRPQETAGMWYRNPLKPLSANGVAVLRAAQD